MNKVKQWWQKTVFFDIKFIKKLKKEKQKPVKIIDTFKLQ